MKFTKLVSIMIVFVLLSTAVYAGTGPLFIRGDVDSNGQVGITDVTFIFDYLFNSGKFLTHAAAMCQEIVLSLDTGWQLLLEL